MTDHTLSQEIRAAHDDHWPNIGDDEMSSWAIRVEKLEDELERLRTALGVLAEFSRSAPGILPGHVVESIGVYYMTLPSTEHESGGRPIVATEPKP